MSAGDPAARARAVVCAVLAAGWRGLLVTGWGGLESADAGPDVLVRGSVHHATVLPRCAAAVHHGGAGTVRAGLPSVTVPFLADQPFWATPLYRRAGRRAGAAPAADGRAGWPARSPHCPLRTQPAASPWRRSSAPSRAAAAAPRCSP